MTYLHKVFFFFSCAGWCHNCSFSFIFLALLGLVWFLLLGCNNSFDTFDEAFSIFPDLFSFYNKNYSKKLSRSILNIVYTVSGYP